MLAAVQNNHPYDDSEQVDEGSVEMIIRCLRSSAMQRKLAPKIQGAKGLTLTRDYTLVIASTICSTLLSRQPELLKLEKMKPKYVLQRLNHSKHRHPGGPTVVRCV